MGRQEELEPRGNQISPALTKYFRLYAPTSKRLRCHHFKATSRQITPYHYPSLFQEQDLRGKQVKILLKNRNSKWAN